MDHRHFTAETDPGSDRQYRMRVDLVVVLCVAAVALSLPTLSTCNPLYVMTAPNLLRVGTPEKVFVEAQDYSGGALNVRIKVLNYPSKTRELTSMSVMLTKATEYQMLTDITIPNKEGYFQEDDTVNQYVYMQAEFPGQRLEKKVLVSFQSGYIFMQTDKTIYTPSSTVFYRAFALSPSMKPEASGVSVEIMTPGGITIRKDVVQPDGGMDSGQYKLPEIVSFGTWKVIARFTDAPLRNFTAEFEVKEYVLPSFEVSLTLEKPFFYVDDQEFEVDITARYLYGKEVNGHGFVVFGVMTSDEGKTSLAQSLRRVEIRNGKGKAILRRQHITQTFPKINELVGSSIYVSVSVLTESGSEMVEAQKKDILIVTSPYTIHFKRTPKYFKPGMPFDVSVLVTNPDNTPADKVDVEVTSAGQSVVGSTRSNGMVKLTINTEGRVANLPITVKTKSRELTDARQARQTMTAIPYQTQRGSRNYLHIGVAAAEFTIGEQVKVNLNLGGSPGAQNQDLTLLILSKGQLVRAQRIDRKGQSLLSWYLDVTKDMVPSFRIVAYYHVGSSEVVSDSVWVDVKDTCMGTLKVEATRSTVSYQPREKYSLKITGDPGARVGLVAVDKGVYVLNNKHRLTQTKIWDIVEKYDTGCTAGSGKDNMGVFFDAGLIFQSSTAGGTGERNVPTCPMPAKRRRRAITIQDLHNTLTGKYTGTDRQCCVDGMKDNILGFTCERRAEYITDGDKCVQAFLHCCKEMSKTRQEAKDEDLVLARSEAEDYTASEDIVSRSQFPESWLWEDDALPRCESHDRHCATTYLTKTGALKDSITSWEVTAISISRTNGICVADPYEMIVMKDFFIDLRLPYSAVLEEQIEIKAILYNYREDAITVRLELRETNDVCSLATKKGKYLTSVEIDGMSSRAVPFVIVPMKLGKHTIEVKGAVRNSFLNDGVKKDLLVVAKGILTEIPTKKIVLKPREHGGRQVERIVSNLPAKQVPGTPSNTIISLSAEQITLTIEKAISGYSMGSLIVQPSGCGEQNMIYMTLPLIATHYLDTTNQWNMVGLGKRATAINYINLGYQQELKFRKNDGGFAVWASSPTSSWLTAYVAKVFAMASDIIRIEDRVVCEALKWLGLNSQQPDGIFKETYRVYHAEMVGGVRGSDSEASMTAFVLIAMQEGTKLCNHRVPTLSGSKRRAMQYLEGRLRTLTNPYAIALVSYALANEGRLNQEVLFRHASSDHTHWPVHGNKLFTLEATAYALLALVKVKEFKKAGPIVNWLNSQQRSGGGYGSTQATIMVFQAVAAYSAEASTQKQELNLNVHIQPSDPTRNKPIQWIFTKNNKFQTQSSKMDLDQDLTVTASGTGEATLTVTTLYYAMPIEKDSDCKMFKVDVNLEKAKRADGGTIETYKLIIDFIYLSKERPSTMAILDIGLPTGFSVDESDLTSLSTGADRYIQRFEMDKMLSDRGSLIIYLDQVSNTRTDRVAFRLHKVMNVGLLQPASVTMYEYLDMDNRCVKFYHPSKENGMLKRICEKGLCKCAEEACSTRKMEKIKSKERWDWVCQRATDFVYKFTVESKDLSINIDVYNVIIEQVIKAGDDDVDVDDDSMREFSAYPVCRDMLALEVGKTYFIMGHKKDYLGGKKYLMSYNTWLEYWPTDEEAKTPKYKDVYEEIEILSSDISTFGC